MGIEWLMESFKKLGLLMKIHGIQRTVRYVLDCYHDFDGCLIASSYKGIVKQKSANRYGSLCSHSLNKENKQRYRLTKSLNLRQD